MRLLERQIDQFVRRDEYRPCGKVLASSLEWGSRPGLENLRRVFEGAGVDSRPSVIIGADVVCWPACVVPLLETVKALFLDLEDPYSGALFVGYVCRATDTRDLFFAAAKEMGFICEKISADDFLPLSSGEDFSDDPSNEGGACAESSGHRPEQRHWPKNVRSRYDLEIYHIVLDASNEASLVPPSLAGLKEGSTQSLPY